MYILSVSGQSRLAKGPLTHRRMSMVHRVENLLCGFVLVDLYRLIASRECKKRSLPAGTLFLAEETLRNIQQCALGGLSVCLTKDPLGDPFAHGHARLSELSVEEWFGRQRVQSPSAQLTARAYWAAVCRTMLKDKRNSSKRGDTELQLETLDPISAEGFFAASEKALSSALQLVSMTSDYAVKDLEILYGRWCENKEYTQEDAVEEPEDDDLDDGDSDDGNVNALGVIKQMHVETCMETMAEQMEEHDSVDISLQGQPDKDLWKEMISAKEEVLDARAILMPQTLNEALGMLGKTPSETELFDRVWRLIMGVRYYRGGGDCHWVADPRACRRKSDTKLNWYQCLGCMFEKSIRFNEIQL